MADLEQVIFILKSMDAKLDRTTELCTRHDETLNNEKTGLVTVVDDNTKAIQAMQTEDRVRKAKFMTGVTLLGVFGGFGGHLAAASDKVSAILEKAKGIFE